MYFGISFHFSWLIYFYFMVTNFYSFYKKEKKIINNCGCLCNCSPEPEFIEEIVETVWKTLYVESPTSTIPPCRQNDVQNAIAGRTHRLFFFSLNSRTEISGSSNFKSTNDSGDATAHHLNSSWLSHFPMQVPLNFQVQLKKIK